MLVQQVVHLPELPLSGGGLPRFSCALRVRVHLRQREVPEDEAEADAQRLLHLVDDRIGLPAIRALVVAILDQGDRRVLRTLAVISLGNRRGQAAHRFPFPVPSPSKASRMPSAPGFTATGETYAQRIMPSASMTNSARSLVPSSARQTP